MSHEIIILTLIQIGWHMNMVTWTKIRWRNFKQRIKIGSSLISWGKVADEVLQEQEFHLRFLLIWKNTKQDIAKNSGWFVL